MANLLDALAMRISNSLFSLLFFFPANLFSQQTYRLDFQSNSIDLPIRFDTPSQGKIILASQIFDNNIVKESTASYLTAQADTFRRRVFRISGRRKP